MSTFIKISNRDIYDKIEKFMKKNAEEHAQLSMNQKETNGKVKLNRWMATTALSLVIIVIGLYVR